MHNKLAQNSVLESPLFNAAALASAGYLINKLIKSDEEESSVSDWLLPITLGASGAFLRPLGALSGGGEAISLSGVPQGQEQRGGSSLLGKVVFNPATLTGLGTAGGYGIGVGAEKYMKSRAAKGETSSESAKPAPETSAGTPKTNVETPKAEGTAPSTETIKPSESTSTTSAEPAAESPKPAAEPSKPAAEPSKPAAESSGGGVIRGKAQPGMGASGPGKMKLSDELLAKARANPRKAGALIGMLFMLGASSLLNFLND